MVLMTPDRIAVGGDGEGRPAELRPKGLCIVTRCTTVEEFIARFHPYCDETSLFVTTGGTRAVGVESPFAILLADKTPVMRGWCVVFDAWHDANNPFGRPGIRVGLHRLTASSKQIFDQLQARAKALAAGPLPTVRSTQMIAAITSTVSEGAAVPTRAPRAVSEGTGVPRPVPRPLTVRIPAVSSAKPQRSTPLALPVIPPRKPTAAIPVIHVQDAPTERMACPPAHMPQGLAEPVPVMEAAEAAAATLLEPRSTAMADGTAVMQPVRDGSPTPREIRAEGSTETRTAETRTPGSEMVLPANPLMNLTDELLEGFVDCRLYEETGKFFIEDAPREARAMTAQPEPAAEDDAVAIVDTPQRPIRVTSELQLAAPVPVVWEAAPVVPATHRLHPRWATVALVASVLALVLALVFAFAR
jgi:hypothetical protein